MKCPNCNKIMKETDNFELRRCIDEDGFSFNHAYMKVFTYSCDSCQIEFKKDEYDGPFSLPDKWILPDKFKPSEKQIKFAKNIAEVLDLNTDDLITKNQYWNFIKQNEAKFKEKQESKHTFDELFYEEMGEYYAEAWFN